jgi:hypothetical protein
MAMHSDKYHRLWLPRPKASYASVMDQYVNYRIRTGSFGHHACDSRIFQDRHGCSFNALFFSVGWFLVILIGLMGVIFSGRYIDQNDMGTLQEF